LRRQGGGGAPLGIVVVDQVKLGATARALPNWSNPWATNDWLTPDTVSN